MTLNRSQDWMDARLVGGLQALIDAGSDPAWLECYDGTQPAGGAALGSENNLLALILLAKPTVFAGHQLLLTAVDPAGSLVTKQGNMTWARLRNGNGLWLLDGDASTGAGTGVFKVTGTLSGTTLLYLGAHAILGTTAIV